MAWHTPSRWAGDDRRAGPAGRPACWVLGASRPPASHVPSTLPHSRSSTRYWSASDTWSRRIRSLQVRQRAAFYDRSRRGVGGYFLLAEAIDRSMAREVSWVIRQHVPGVRILGGEIYVARGRDCPPDVYLDGARQGELAGAMETARAFIDQVDLASIEGVEVYRGPASLPAGFGGTTGQCGVIAIWTRRGPRHPSPRPRVAVRATWYPDCPEGMRRIRRRDRTRGRLLRRQQPWSHAQGS